MVVGSLLLPQYVVCELTFLQDVTHKWRVKKEILWRIPTPKIDPIRQLYANGQQSAPSIPKSAERRGLDRCHALKSGFNRP